LQQFVNRVDIGLWDILIAVLADTTVVLATVSYQAIKAASANPVISLRYE
jgi:putative ABC transport system permease protein